MTAHAKANAIAVLAVAPETFRRLPNHGERRLRVCAVLFAVLLHASAIYIVTGAGEQPVGAGGIVLDAVSVEVTLIPSSALESRSDGVMPAVGSAEAAEVKEGAPVPTMTAPRIEPERKTERQQDKDHIPTAPESEQDADLQSGLERIEDKDRIKDRKKEAREPPSIRHPVGGVTARVEMTEANPSQGAAIASPGVVRDYANRVLAALNRTRPKGTGLRGTVRLSFAVGPDGKIEFVHVLKSSGRQSLHEMAVAAVRRATIPAAPASLSAMQRTFELPYQFR